ncbi:hypothetical protein HOP51_20470 [Halomonas sp. MCCC 1A11036]|uniref:DUF3742 family protein n=1 Tax=Billgrantia zhangzhouensis TaxID=2733481 RepID=A0ABS9AL38_9GAMM|nr:hypothetical protein [Halomonas zhangzhouensis]MCE8022464.1 hypothetical protein [Halomonas zhangzhouensis]
MFDPNDPRNAYRNNAAWQAAQQWRSRMNRPGGGPLGGLKLMFTWLLFGLLLIVGTVLGLFLLLLGWALLPIMRYRMKKRMERMRAEQATDVGGSHRQEGRPSRDSALLEGDYEVKDDR